MMNFWSILYIIPFLRKNLRFEGGRKVEREEGTATVIIQRPFATMH